MKVFNTTLYFLAVCILSSCSSLPSHSPGADAKFFARKAAIRAAQPILEKVLFENAPVKSPDRTRFPQAANLPGGLFREHQVVKNSIAFDPHGNLLLAPGDYTIPVLPFCIRMASASPSGFIYTLASMEGARAEMMGEVLQQGLDHYSFDDVQVLLWNLQSGVSSDEMPSKTRMMIDQLIPGRRKELKESSLGQLEKKWSELSESSNGLIPDFNETSNEFLHELGEVGERIIELKRMKQEVRERGSDFSNWNELIDTETKVKSQLKTTPWNKVGDRVYARFITSGHFLDIARIQIRVLPDKSRRPNSTHSDKVSVNLTTWLADPMTGAVQPLSFALLIGPRGAYLVPTVLRNPVIAAAALTALLAAEMVDWESVLKLSDVLRSSSDSRVKDLIQKNDQVLNEKLDALEKEAREKRIITGKTKNTTSIKNKKTREYEKEGGEEQLQKDFDEFSGEAEQKEKGIQVKVQLSGISVVKRPIDKDKQPTLEIQGPDKFSVKVRYRK